MMGSSFNNFKLKCIHCLTKTPQKKFKLNFFNIYNLTVKKFTKLK